VDGGTENISASLERGKECSQVQLTTPTKRMQQYDLFKSLPRIVLYGIFDMARRHSIKEEFSYYELEGKEKEKVIG